MAKVVCGIATSHGPMLATPPDMWHLRGGADRKNPGHWFKGERFDYGALLQKRAPGFAENPFARHTLVGLSDTKISGDTP